MKRGRARTNSKDSDFFLNDDFGFLAPKISKSPIGRAKYDKAGYPLIGQREFQFPQYKNKQYNGTKPKLRDKYKSRRTQSMGNRAFSTSLGLNTSSPPTANSVTSNTRAHNKKPRKKKAPKSVSRYKSARTIGKHKRVHSLPAKTPSGKPVARPISMPLDISTLPESKEYVTKKPKPSDTQHSDIKPTMRIYKTFVSDPILPMPHDYSPSAYNGIYGWYPAKVTAETVADNNTLESKKKSKSKPKKKESTATSKAKTSNKRKKKRQKMANNNNNNVVNKEDGKKSNKNKHSKKSKKKKTLKGSSVRNHMKLFESETISTDDDGNHTSDDHESKPIILKPIQQETEPNGDDVLSLQKPMILEHIKDVDDNVNDANITPPSEEDKTKTELQIDYGLSDSKLIIPKTGTNNEDDRDVKCIDFSDSNAMIHDKDTNTEDEKDGTQLNSNRLVIVAANTKTEEPPIVAPQKDKDGLSNSHLVIAKTKTEDPEPVWWIEHLADDLSDSHVVIMNTEGDKKGENKDGLTLQDDKSKTEQPTSVPPKDSDDLTDSNVIIHKANTNTEDDQDAKEFESNHLMIVAPNDNEKKIEKVLSLEEEKTKTEKEIIAAPAKETDELSDSKLIIHKKTDESENESDPKEFEASGLMIARRQLDDKQDGTVAPFGAEQTAMERKRDLGDADEDALWESERYRMEQEMENQLKAEEDRYKMRMLAIRQMREKLRKKGSRNAFEEERLWLSQSGDNNQSGWQLKWPFDFSSLGLNFNWITVQYDEVEYNEEGNVVLTVHGQKVELPSSKVLKNTESQ